MNSLSRTSRCLLSAVLVLWLNFTGCACLYAADNEAFKNADNVMSDDSRQLAEQVNVLTPLNDMRQLRQSGMAADDVRMLARRQDITENLITVQQQVRTSAAIIDAEIARADDVRAQLEQHRDKALKLTTMANLVTGSFNGIGGNSMGISNRLKLPSDILDIADGAVQTGLATLALREQGGEHRTIGSLGSLLSRFCDLSQPIDFPPAVAGYLNSVPSGTAGGLTRRGLLIDRWARMHIIRRTTRTKWEHRLSDIREQADSHKITVDLLEDRDAMLHDLRATITAMDGNLLDLMTAIQTLKRPL